MNWEQIHSVFFIGIGGIGMSALARYMNANGYAVGGYDRTSSELTLQLESEGIFITYTDDTDSVPEKFKNKEHTLVIITPAVPSSHKALQWFLHENFEVIKRAKALGLIANRNNLVAVAGTHGKTTTTGMIAHILTHAGIGCQAFLGGITKNYNTNLLLHPSSKWAVAEADEYDRSFLHLTPDIAIITSIDADHLDIYANYNDINQTFNDFVAGMRTDGTLILQHDLRHKIQVPSHISVHTYGIEKDTADFQALNIKQDGLFYTFDVKTPDNKIYQNFKTGIVGIINVLNAVAAIAASITAGVNIESIRLAVVTYTGNKRRFDILHQSEDFMLIDDYAHHPKEIEAFGQSLRLLFGTKKLTVIFQPHLYSRTRDFAEEFGKALSVFDEVIVTDIYPAREMPIEGINPDSILTHITHHNKHYISKSQLVQYASELNTNVLATVGAGDIEHTAHILKEFFQKKSNKT